MRALRTKPRGGPVERAEKSARGNRRVAAAKLAPLHPAGDERSDAALVLVALGDDERAQFCGQGIDLEVRRRTLDAVDEAQHVGDGEGTKPAGERPPASRHFVERREEAIERAILAEVQQLFLAAKIVIKVGRGQVGRDGDLAHPGGGKTTVPEDSGRGAEDLEPAAIGPLAEARDAAGLDRTAVR